MPAAAREDHMAPEKKDLLQEFETRKTRVVGFAERLRSLAVERADNEAAQVLDGFMRRFRETRFLALVVGDFKSGKSTFVNALVGRAICPVKATPRTAKITRLTALPEGDSQEYALIHYRHAEEPERVPISDVSLDDLVAHKGSRTDAVQHVDLFLKPDGTLLRHPLMIVDTPGLGSGEEAHSRVTRDYMQHADALVFVFSASKPFSETERDFLLSFRSLLPRTLFVVNQADRIAEDERSEVLAHIRDSLREGVLGADSADPQLLLVSARDAMGARVRGSAEALAESGLTALVEELERKLANEHGTPMLLSIAVQHRDVCAGLIHQAVLAREALSADGAGRTSFEANRETLRTELAGLRAEKARVLDALAAHRADLLGRVVQRVEAVNGAILQEATAWVTNQCASEAVCKRDLPGLLSKLLADHLESLDAQLLDAYGKIADRACERVSKTLAKVEERTRAILAPGERKEVREQDELRKAMAALANLDAVAAGVGGPTGGYGVARNALNTALVPSPAATVLSVAAAVGFVIAAASGVGWIVAGFAGFLAAVFGISHSSGWRARVVGQVSERLRADVFPKVSEEAEASVHAFFDSLRDEVSQHIEGVQARLERVVDRVAADYKREERQRQQEFQRLDAYLTRAKTLVADIDAFVAELPAPTPPVQATQPKPLLPEAASPRANE
jgi:GTP-binding protein EngB required for normal cell division